MAWDTFITVDELSKISAHPETAIFDCRYDLADAGWGYQAFLDSHIPGAQYVDLEKDLSDQPDGKNGRHPLPTVESLSSLFSNLGIDETVQAVCYDDQGGAYMGFEFSSVTTAQLTALESWLVTCSSYLCEA